MFLDILKSWDEGEQDDIKYDVIRNIFLGFGALIRKVYKI